jgi:hypothetical protein
LRFRFCFFALAFLVVIPSAARNLLSPVLRDRTDTRRCFAFARS